MAKERERGRGGRAEERRGGLPSFGPSEQFNQQLAQPWCRGARIPLYY